MLIKKGSAQARTRLGSAVSQAAAAAVDRRAFLKASGLTAAGLAAAGTLTAGSVRPAQAAMSTGAGIVKRKNVYTHCSVV